MLLDLINLHKIRRAVLYALYIIIVLVFQNLVFSRVSLLGVRCMFVPAAAVAIGMFQGSAWGAVFGLVTGYLCDMSCSENAVMFTLLFSVFGFFSGALSQRLINKRFFAYLIVCIGAFVITAAVQSFRHLFILGSDVEDVLITAALQALWSIPFSVPLYYPCKRLASLPL